MVVARRPRRRRGSESGDRADAVDGRTGGDRRAPAWRDRRVWLGAIGGAALAALHPLYYWTRLGRLSLLGGLTIGEVPSFAQWSAPLIDPNVGILINFPWLTIALAIAIVALARRSPHVLRAPAVLVSIGALAVFLTSFSQIPNVNHGGHARGSAGTRAVVCANDAVDLRAV